MPFLCSRVASELFTLEQFRIQLISHPGIGNCLWLRSLQTKPGEHLHFPCESSWLPVGQPLQSFQPVLRFRTGTSFCHRVGGGFNQKACFCLTAATVTKIHSYSYIDMVEGATSPVSAAEDLLHGEVCFPLDSPGVLKESGSWFHLAGGGAGESNFTGDGVTRWTPRH